MKTSFTVCLGIVALGLAIGGLTQGSLAVESAQPEAAAAGAVKLETLLSAELEGIEGTEVLVSRVTIPPNTSLPKH